MPAISHVNTYHVLQQPQVKIGGRPEAPPICAHADLHRVSLTRGGLAFKVWLQTGARLCECRDIMTCGHMLPFDRTALLAISGGHVLHVSSLLMQF